MNKGDAHIIFNGQSRHLKFFVYGEANPRHIWVAHDVGVNDQYVLAGEDEYGHRCKCPPGHNYTLGPPQTLSPREDAYGYFFTPINDDPKGDMLLHGRAGIGIHGGGTGLADPFADFQGFEWTFGCIRLQNFDNATFVNSVRYIQSHGGTCFLDVIWP